MKRIFVFIILLLLSNSATANELYRSPSTGDKGTYYVVKSNKIGKNTFRVLTSRIGKGDAYTDFTDLKVNCKSMQYFILAGLSEDGVKNKPSKKLKDWSKNSKWTSLISGSSKYDLVRHICKKYN